MVAICASQKACVPASAAFIYQSSFEMARLCYRESSYLFTAPIPMPTALPSHRRRSVLIVDDDREIRELFTTILRMAGFEVRSAIDGTGALQQVEDRYPDVVVLDLGLPLMGGIAVHEELQSRAETRDLPVVIVTGTDVDSPYPAYATLRKPVDPDRLV